MTPTNPWPEIDRMLFPCKDSGTGAPVDASQGVRRLPVAPRTREPAVPSIPWVELETPCVQCWHDCRFHGDCDQDFTCRVNGCECLGFSVQALDVITEGNASS